MIGSAFLSTWFPEAASTRVANVDGPFNGILIGAILVLLLFVGLVIVQLRIYRRQDRNQLGAVTGRPNDLFRGLLVVGALGLAAWAFLAGVPGYIDQTSQPYGAYEVDVTARQWAWEFTYPNGHVADTLHVPVDSPVRLNMLSADVAHTLAVPALRVSTPIMPDQVMRTWFRADVPGHYDLHSNTFSGDGFESMKSELVVHSSADFKAWMLAAADIFKGRTLEEVGELLYTRHGCAACHSLDGTKLIGPSFKDMYGFEFETVEGGTVTVDDAYISESILKPNASVIAGYQPVMTPYEGKINDKEIGAITAWLKTMSSRGGTELATEPAPEPEEN